MVHGYKGFTHDMTCRDFQYEVGQTYEHNGYIGLCESGFHFCRNMADVLNYYGGRNCRYAEVEVLGEVIDGEDKSVTDMIRIVRELSWEEVLKEMAVCAGLGIETSSFPADEVIKARKNGTLSELLPSGTEFPVQFANGERNILVVARDETHTYLIMKYLMAEPLAMSNVWTNEGGWPACGMRKHVQEIYDMLPESFHKAVIPMHIKQLAQGIAVECDDMAFLLSTVNVFGKNAWGPKAGCDDTQIDIFREFASGVKGRLGGSGASWWWLRPLLPTTISTMWTATAAMAAPTPPARAAWSSPSASRIAVPGTDEHCLFSDLFQKAKKQLVIMTGYFYVSAGIQRDGRL